MSFLLHLDSQSTGLRYNAKPEDFTVDNLNLQLDVSREYEVALLSASIWYSWYNVCDSQFNNAKWRYSINGGLTWIQHTIPDGLYSVDAINSYFEKIISADGNNPSNLVLSANYSTLRCVIALTGYQIDLQSSQSKLHELLGFNSQVLTSTKEGENPVNITNDINSISIHCSLIDSNSSFLNNEHTDTLFSFVPRSGPSTLLDVRPLHLIYLPMLSKNISSINLRVTNQLNNLIDLNNEPTSYVLHIREKTK